MGTVGLSFGSPTSGAGFNVSATVAAIVGNLQNVETPWKTQLTALEGQDTALSNLGTLFSNLSNDVNALTDVQGVLSQKTGSSSDTNVLELTSATSAAVAGTHTVVVNSLATTSSGYVAPITNASDTLSGSISIVVGSGQAKVFTIGSSDNTLASLAAAINSSGAGVTASVLTDSSGSRLSLVSGTSGLHGNLTVTSSLLDASNSNAALGYTAAAGGADASLKVDGVTLTSASNTVTNLIPGVTFQLLAPSATESGGVLESIQVVIGNDTGGVGSAINNMVNDYNTLISAMNTQEGNDSSGHAEPLYGSPTLSLLQQQLLGGLNIQNPNGSLDSISTNTNTTLAGSISIQVGSGAAQTVTLNSSQTTLASLAQAIDAANIGVTATVVTHGTQSNLSLLSGTAGPGGALTVNSSLVATGDTPLAYSGTPATGTQNSTGTLTAIPGASDVLSGSLAISIGGAPAQAVTLDGTDNTLAGLAGAINTAAIGVTASVVTNSNGTSSLSLLSNISGSAGSLTVTSSLLDITSTTSTTLNYTNSSDLSTLANVGVLVSTKDDGSISLNVATLTTALNSDYSGILGFFQNADSWGMNFANVLTNAGTSTATGVLSLAENSNRQIESTLNADISKEEIQISVEQKSLTAELDSANTLLEELPAQLNAANELYSAITGYNQNRNG